MAEQQPPLTTLFSQVDVSTGSQPQSVLPSDAEQSEIMREMLCAQDRTNELLEELVGVMAAQQKQRAQELNQWKSANPDLANNCRRAAELLSKVQVDYLERMTDEIAETHEDLLYGDYMLNEFIDRFGPRLAHLNGVIQVLAQLSTSPASNGEQQS